MLRIREKVFQIRKRLLFLKYDSAENEKERDKVLPEIQKALRFTQFDHTSYGKIQSFADTFEEFKGEDNGKAINLFADKSDLMQVRPDLYDIDTSEYLEDLKELEKAKDKIDEMAIKEY